MKDTGDNIKSNDLLSVDVKEKKLHLPKREVFLGTRVEDFLQELGMSRESPELEGWFMAVFDFYMKATKYAFKYFSLALTSKLLMNLDILNPKSLLCLPPDDLKRK